MKIYLILVIPMILFSCFQKGYNVTSEYVESITSLENGFLFYSINVDSVNRDSVPIVYSVLRKSSVDPRDTGSLMPKRIYFHIKSDAYRWFDFESFEMYDTLPIRMESNKWYLISGLMGNNGMPNHQIFIFITTRGAYKFYYYNKITNW